jgi:hypothetical protein
VAVREADVRIHRISQLSGVSRTTIYKILGLDARADDKDHSPTTTAPELHGRLRPAVTRS